MRQIFLSLFLLLLLQSPIVAQNHPPAVAAPTQVPETHLKNIRQLTFGGDNAEAYWSPDSKSLTFQSNNAKWGLQCDQIFTMKVKDAAGDSTYKPQTISTLKGRTTCSF
ncbi:MAG: hypothetical protein RIQ78_989, partial [Bacteroidota bacterium]